MQRWAVFYRADGCVSGKEAWSTFEVEFIKGEVDRRCEELVSGDGWLSVHRG